MVSGHGDALPRNEASWNTVGSIACNGLSTTEATDVHAAMQTKKFAVAWSKNHRVASTSAEPCFRIVRVSARSKKYSATMTTASAEGNARQKKQQTRGGNARTKIVEHNFFLKRLLQRRGRLNRLRSMMRVATQRRDEPEEQCHREREIEQKI